MGLYENLGHRVCIFTLCTTRLPFLNGPTYLECSPHPSWRFIYPYNSANTWHFLAFHFFVSLIDLKQYLFILNFISVITDVSSTFLVVCLWDFLLCNLSVLMFCHFFLFRASVFYGLMFSVWESVVVCILSCVCMYVFQIRE